MKIEIPAWTAHHNQILYSLLRYSEIHKSTFEIVLNRSIPPNGAILHVDQKIAFLDYSDDFNFIVDPSKFQIYFKRSLSNKVPHALNVVTLNFNVSSMAYKPLKLISKMKLNLLKHPSSKVEFVRALDIFSLFTNDSHSSKDIRNTYKKQKGSEGRVLFMTRLWDPARAIDQAEKARRLLQNDFRINACRIIKANFPNSAVGVFPDYFAKEHAPDILLNIKDTTRAKYAKELANCDIGIADEGLKDSTGWKFGEYILTGKAIITTPLNTVAENFHEGANYLATQNRSDFESLPALIESLLQNNSYLAMQQNNISWREKFLAPEAYIANIISKISSISDR